MRGGGGDSGRNEAELAAAAPCDDRHRGPCDSIIIKIVMERWRFYVKQWRRMACDIMYPIYYSANKTLRNVFIRILIAVCKQIYDTLFCTP